MDERKSKRVVILALVENSEIELFPVEISKKLGYNPSTVRYYLRQLVKEGKLVQPYKGSYCSHITYGMIVVPLRVHNVVLSVDAPFLGVKIGDFVEFTEDVKVRVLFGVQRRRISVFLSCDGGMDRRTLSFALNRAYDVVEEKTGRVVDSVVVKSFECNRDFHGVRIDGARCFTRKGFEDFLDRVYQKDDLTVRGETKFSRSMRVEEMLSLLHGGVPSLELTQGVFVLKQTVERLVDALKFQNRMLLEVKERIESLEKVS